MKKIFQIVLVISFLLANLTPTTKVKAAESFSNQSFIIKTSNPTKTEGLLKSLEVGFEKIDSLSAYVVNLEKNQDEIIGQLTRESSTVYIEENKKTRLSQTPNDPYFVSQNYLQNSNIVNAWEISAGSPNIVVAVIDTGVNYNHEDLRNNIWTNSVGAHGYDFVNNDSDPMDDNGHGTSIAGVIAAAKNNGIGIAGSANVKIMAVKAVPASGEGDVVDLAHGITYAADNGARVANVSLGLMEESALLDEAITYAKSKGCLIVAAVGNMYRSFIDNPARNPSAIGVTAVGTNDLRANYANYGEGTGISALGAKILSTGWDVTNQTSLYEYASGTSFSTPQVTATAAMILSRDPSLTTDQVKKRILSSAKKLAAMGGVNYSVEYGYGKLDAYAALTFDKNPPEVNLALYKTPYNSYSLKGQIIDEKNSTVVLPDIPNSNIATVRYQIDNTGSWVVLNSTATQIANIDTALGALNAGNHTVTVEASDTAGNAKTMILNSQDAVLTNVQTSSNLSDYRYELAEQSGFVEATVGQTINMSLAFRNVGNTIWDKNKVRLGTTRSMDRSSAFANQTWLSPNRISMQEDFVETGQLAHFNFTITIPNGASGEYKEYFNLVAEGIGWMRDIGIYWSINIGQQSFHASYINQSPYISITPGGEANLWVEYKNTGSATWGSKFNLGTSNPQDRDSAFYNNKADTRWKATNRIGMNKSTVAPGEIARFNFTIKAPMQSGVYQEYFRPVADGISWMEDYGLYWQISVQ